MVKDRRSGSRRGNIRHALQAVPGDWSPLVLPGRELTGERRVHVGVIPNGPVTAAQPEPVPAIRAHSPECYC